MTHWHSLSSLCCLLAARQCKNLYFALPLIEGHLELALEVSKFKFQPVPHLRKTEKQNKTTTRKQVGGSSALNLLTHQIPAWWRVWLAPFFVQCVDQSSQRRTKQKFMYTTQLNVTCSQYRVPDSWSEQSGASITVPIYCKSPDRLTDRLTFNYSFESSASWPLRVCNVCVRSSAKRQLNLVESRSLKFPQQNKTHK